MNKRNISLVIPVLFLFSLLFLFTACPSPTSSAGSNGGTLSSAKDLTGFGFKGVIVINAAVDTTAHTVIVVVPSGTVLSNLIAIFVDSGVAVKVGSTDQVSGTTPQDFTNPVTYTVIAADGSSVNYTVTVTQAAINANLSNLAVTDGSTTYPVAPTFSPTTYAGYSVSLAISTNTYTLQLTVSDPNATITSVMEGPLGNQVALTPSAGIYTLLLSTYFDVVSVLVTAQDGVTQQTYTINVYPSWRG